MRRSEKERYLKDIVLYCLAFSTLLIVAGGVLLAFEIDIIDFARLGIGLFGGELLLSCLIRLFGDVPRKAPVATKTDDAEETDGANG